MALLFDPQNHNLRRKKLIALVLVKLLFVGRLVNSLVGCRKFNNFAAQMTTRQMERNLVHKALAG